MVSALSSASVTAAWQHIKVTLSNFM